MNATPFTPSKPLRVALAGAGMISWHHLIAWRNLGERVRLVAVCDPDVDKATRRTREFDIPNVYREADAMFAAESIDALDVASPRETHAAWVDAAATRGIDVLCQKPMTPTLTESQALVRRVDGKSRLMVHENWRFRPGIPPATVAAAARPVSCADDDDRIRAPDASGRQTGARSAPRSWPRSG